VAAASEHGSSLLPAGKNGVIDIKQEIQVRKDRNEANQQL
jgi:hypothetical protein